MGTDGLNQPIWMIHLILFGYMAESDFSRNDFSRFVSHELVLNLPQNNSTTIKSLKLF